MTGFPYKGFKLKDDFEYLLFMAVLMAKIWPHSK